MKIKFNKNELRLPRTGEVWCFDNIKAPLEDSEMYMRISDKQGEDVYPAQISDIYFYSIELSSGHIVWYPRDVKSKIKFPNAEVVING